MTRIERFKQLKSYGLERQSLIEKIPETNEEILKDPKFKKALERFINV